jgi:hypothetical protein
MADGTVVSEIPGVRILLTMAGDTIEDQFFTQDVRVG